MKVKHWQGYGIVEMKKISQKINGNEKTIVVRVIGNHEWGLDTEVCDYTITYKISKEV